MVASGQNGQKPLVYIWSSIDGEYLEKKRLPKGSRLVTAIGISVNNKYVFASDAREKVTAYMFKLGDESEAPIKEFEINATVTHLMAHPSEDKQFVTCGKKHVIFFDGGNEGKGKSAGTGFNSINMAAIAFSQKTGGVSWGAGSDGQIYKFNGNKASSKPITNNKGSVYTIASKMS